MSDLTNAPFSLSAGSSVIAIMTADNGASDSFTSAENTVNAVVQSVPTTAPASPSVTVLSTTSLKVSWTALTTA